MTLGPKLTPLPGPAAVSVHNNTHMGGDDQRRFENLRFWQIILLQNSLSFEQPGILLSEQ
jgi:hypothetical protein